MVTEYCIYVKLSQGHYQIILYWFSFLVAKETSPKMSR